MARATKTIKKFQGNAQQAYEELSIIQRRLEELSYDGDCAYEKALVAFYSERLQQCQFVIKLSA